MTTTRGTTAAGRPSFPLSAKPAPPPHPTLVLGGDDKAEHKEQYYSTAALPQHAHASAHAYMLHPAVMLDRGGKPPPPTISVHADLSQTASMHSESSTFSDIYDITNSQNDTDNSYHPAHNLDIFMPGGIVHNIWNVPGFSSNLWLA